MSVLKLIPVYLLFLFLSGAILPLVSHATHKKPCCSCSSCNPMCTCRGTNYHCPICPGRSSDSSPTDALTATGPLDIRAVRNPDATERLAHLTKVGDCARRSFAFRILGEAAESLKVQAFSPGEDNRSDNIAAAQVAVNAAQ
jgi:hypothetical protein